MTGFYETPPRRVLLYFIDMFRAQLIDGSPTRWMTELGGTNYTNAWSPGPDTPRGLSSFLYGRYPGESGHFRRSDYPFPKIKKSNVSILEIFSRHGYIVFVLQSKIDASFNRLVPPTPPKGWRYFTAREELFEALRRAPTNQKIIVFYQNNDYHYEIDRSNNAFVGHTLGIKRVASDVELLINTLGTSFFDIGYFFSDHGCVFAEEAVDERSWLDDRRGRSFLFKTTFAGGKVVSNSNLIDLPKAHGMVVRDVFEEHCDRGLEGWTVVEDYPMNHFPLENERLTEWLVLGPNGFRLRCSASHSEPDNKLIGALPGEIKEFMTLAAGGMMAFLKILEVRESNKEVKIPSPRFMDSSEVYENGTEPSPNRRRVRLWRLRHRKRRFR